MKTIHALFACTTLAFATSASAQNMKPGLWEITNRMQGGAGAEMDKARAQMQQQMKSMSPEQRKMVEKMMAEKGIRADAGGMTVKTCLTKEQVERNDIASHRGDCKNTMQQRSGNTMKVAFVCTNPPSKGEGQFTFTSPEAYTMHMTVTSTIEGRPQTTTMDASGKWLGANCGSVKPVPGAKK